MPRLTRVGASQPRACEAWDFLVCDGGLDRIFDDAPLVAGKRGRADFIAAEMLWK